MILAGMVTHTSIKDFMDMKIPRFFDLFITLMNVLEKRKHGG